MADLEGQDHGPSSSSVGDNDDDFIVYSKEVIMQGGSRKRGMKFLLKIYFAKLKQLSGYLDIKDLNATTKEDEDDIAKFKDYKPSQPVPLSKIKGTGSDGTIVQADIESGKWRFKTSYLQAQGQSNRSRNKLYRPSDFTNKKRRDKKGLSKIADEVKSFTRKAKENSLKPRRHFHRVKSGRNLWDQAISRHHQSPTTGLLAVDRN
ncbi:hypothetical protein Sjap_017933 [Stephania japonica]|uniref:Uncharacterized protein n=1 Tax=Stephania japonica TaxID=461633 RepID=A0AAP0I726_9MAGN